jgi:hypothetical protein
VLEKLMSALEKNLASAQSDYSNEKDKLKWNEKVINVEKLRVMIRTIGSNSISSYQKYFSIQFPTIISFK